jgi:hypothetical protein
MMVDDHHAAECAAFISTHYRHNSPRDHIKVFCPLVI